MTDIVLYSSSKDQLCTVTYIGIEALVSLSVLALNVSTIFVKDCKQLHSLHFA